MEGLWQTKQLIALLEPGGATELVVLVDKISVLGSEPSVWGFTNSCQRPFSPLAEGPLICSVLIPSLTYHSIYKELARSSLWEETFESKF